MKRSHKTLEEATALELVHELSRRTQAGVIGLVIPDDAGKSQTTTLGWGGYDRQLGLTKIIERNTWRAYEPGALPPVDLDKHLQGDDDEG